jgi:uncharacterized protein YjcR
VINIANIDYSKLKKEYLRGNISYRELAKKYGVPFGTLRKVAAKEQWTQLRTQVRAKADTKIIDAISDKEAERAVDIVDVADKLLGKISELMDAVPLDTQSMKHLTSALKDLKDIKGYKSELDLKEQMARIKKLELEAAYREDDDDKPSGVVLMPAITEELKPPIKGESNG